MRKGKTGLLCLLLGVFLLSACTADTPAAGGAGRDDLIFSVNADIVSLDSAAQRDTVSGIIANQIYDTLVRKTSKGELEAGLATEWRYNDDGTELTLILREGVKFHNGETMTAEDVAFSLNRAIASPMTANVSSAMDSARADGDAVILKLKYPFGPAVECLSAANMGIVSKKAVEELGDDGFAAAPVGTGAYRYVEWKSGEKIVLTRFDDYWMGAPSIKDLTFLIMTDKTTAAIALQNDEIDVLYDPAVTDRTALESAPNVVYSEGSLATHFYMVSFNVGGASPFSDPRVRQAAAYAINREDIVTGALEGNGITVSCPMTPASPGYDPDYDFYSEDLDAAKALLVDAGYPDGFTAVMKLNQSTIYTKPAEIVQAQLRKIGINLEFELMERATYLVEIMDELDYDITLYMYSTAYDDPDYVFYGRLHSENIGNSNYANYSNPEADQMVMEARMSIDESQRADLYSRLCDIVKRDVPFIPLMAGTSVIAYNSGLSGVYPSANNIYYVCEYSWNERP